MLRCLRIDDVIMTRTFLRLRGCWPLMSWPSLCGASVHMSVLSVESTREQWQYEVTNAHTQRETHIQVRLRAGFLQVAKP